jgi:hypothetical protein
MPAHLHLLYFQARLLSFAASNQPDKSLDDCCCNETVAFLLLEESLRVTKGSATIALIPQDTASTTYITRSVSKDLEYFRKLARSRTTWYNSLII